MMVKSVFLEKPSLSREFQEIADHYAKQVPCIPVSVQEVRIYLDVQ
jgi:hypothetical protein